ncbi:hypothetical protein Rhe02_70170 [Rhizocola hellebori]|uniref:Uncharacterized protein n=1 Tax=Rhizocola hellebori TaxID=1392758 RepID=A0A8J3VJQ4_9ACTN|nr:hypothetical protein Rhe02_70170 [Rhizocola hellebori]
MTQDFLTSYGLGGYGGSVAGGLATVEVYRDRIELDKKDRGALFPTAGWDLGRNDHTDENGKERPAESMFLSS